MKVIFSRKGFDSSAGGAASPIIKGCPVSIPIPAAEKSLTSYDDIGLGQIVQKVTRNRLSGTNLCHLDPMFQEERCAFGQVGAAQSHLANNGVGIGDLFLFFGLFSNSDGSDRHHRIFSYLQIEKIISLGESPRLKQQPTGFNHQHPHTIGTWPRNNTLYLGTGSKATNASPKLRLSIQGENVSVWRIPSWLESAGLTYHGHASRWSNDRTLRVVGRGQEFVSDITGLSSAKVWLQDILATIRGSAAVKFPYSVS